MGTLHPACSPLAFWSAAAGRRFLFQETPAKLPNSCRAALHVVRSCLPAAAGLLKNARLRCPLPSDITWTIAPSKASNERLAAFDPHKTTLSSQIAGLVFASQRRRRGMI